MNTENPESSAEARPTVLAPLHEAAGAHFTEFGGSLMPLRYTSQLEEHHAVRQAAGLFDLSHMGQVWVRGPQAGAALDYALTGALSRVSVGRAKYTMIVNEAGGILDDLIVYHLTEEEFLVVPNASNRNLVAEELRQHCTGFKCTVVDESADRALIAVQGPRAAQIVAEVVTCGVAVSAALRPETHGEASTGSDRSVSSCEADVLCGPSLTARLRYYAAVKATAAGHEIILARTGYTGEDGFELFCHARDAADLWQSLTDAGGENLTLCGLAARDSLRLEAGMPLYGHELTAERSPYDVGLGSVVATDTGNTVGGAALAERAATPTASLVALVGEGRRAAREGCPVLSSAGDHIGTVTSGLLSPTLGYPIALAILDPGHETADGETLTVDVRGKTMPMRVVPSPFYRRHN